MMGTSRLRAGLRWMAAVLAMAFVVSEAAAQLYPVRHRPADGGYYRFQTPHFQLIYQDGLFPEAHELSALLEDVYPEVRAAVGLRRPLEAPVVLNRYTDRANGFVSPWPFRQEIEAVNLRGKTLSPRFHSWFETVGPHELAHAAHAESGHGFGVGWLLRKIGPDLARSLNLSGPRGINEGVAVWLESRLRSEAGRLNYSLHEMEFRAAMRSDDPWSLTQMLEPPAYTRPFDRYYHGGGHLFEYLEASQGIDFFHRARNFYYRFPLLGYAPALWYGTGMLPHVLGRRIRRHYREAGHAFVAQLGSITEPQIIVSRKGDVYRRPRWLDNGSLVVYASGYSMRPGFYRIDAATGEREAISHQAVTEDVYFSLSNDSTALYFSRYVPALFSPVRAIAEAFRLNLESGEADRLTYGGRVYGVVEEEEEEEEKARVWGLRNVGQFNAWVAMGGGRREERGEKRGEGGVVGRLGRTELVEVVQSPDGGRIALVANHEGRQGIYEAVLRNGLLDEVRPLVVWNDASVFDASWSPGGQYLVFSADPGGVANIFAMEVESGRVARLTNAAYGAIEPSVSPDGNWLAYVNYRHERYELVRISFDPEGTGGEIRPVMLDEVPEVLQNADSAEQSELRSAAAAGDLLESSAAAEGRRGAGPLSPKPYKALLHVRPRVLYPFLVYQQPADEAEDVSLGFGAGAGIEWADPLQTWTAHTSGYVQHGGFWGRVAVRSGRWVARPTLEAFRSPSTVTVRTGRDTVRVGRDERGVGVAVQTPIVLRSNVYQTNAHVLLRSEFREERLFGRENETLRAADGRITVNPALRLIMAGQQNARDLVPNTGLFVTATSKLDVWTEGGRASRWVRADGRLHIPLLQGSNTGVQINGGLLAQNRGGVVDIGSFLPRGYETSDAFLGEGTYATYGAEITQPLLYVDNGLFIVPIYVKAVFAYGFVESMQALTGDASRLSVAGAGLGVQLRFAHSIDFTLRYAPVYRFESGDWGWTMR